MYVDILYTEAGRDDYTLIESVNNNNFYHWIVPDDIVDNPVAFDIIIPPLDDVIIHTPPILKIYPTPDTKVVDETNVAVISKGVFFANVSEYFIPAYISYENAAGEIIDREFEIHIKNGAVDLEDPIHLEPFIYDGEINYKKINIVVQKHNDPTNRINFIGDENNLKNWITIC